MWRIRYDSYRELNNQCNKIGLQKNIIGCRCVGEAVKTVEYTNLASKAGGSVSKVRTNVKRAILSSRKYRQIGKNQILTIGDLDLKHDYFAVRVSSFKNDFGPVVFLAC
jgi:hypothetical protein